MLVVLKALFMQDAAIHKLCYKQRLNIVNGYSILICLNETLYFVTPFVVDLLVFYLVF